jgi:hypothetical protein
VDTLLRAAAANSGLGTTAAKHWQKSCLSIARTPCRICVDATGFLHCARPVPEELCQSGREAQPVDRPLRAGGVLCLADCDESGWQLRLGGAGARTVRAAGCRHQTPAKTIIFRTMTGGKFSLLPSFAFAIEMPMPEGMMLTPVLLGEENWSPTTRVPPLRRLPPVSPPPLTQRQREGVAIVDNAVRVALRVLGSTPMRSFSAVSPTEPAHVPSFSRCRFRFGRSWHSCPSLRPAPRLPAIRSH